MYEDGVTVMGYLHRICHAQYIPWVREWLQQEPEGIFMGASLSIFNGAFSTMMTFLLNSGASLRRI